MNLLIVEDDETKLDALRNFLDEIMPRSSVSTAHSFHSGLVEALAGNHDLIFLDMTMRNFDRNKDDDGGRPHAFAGREILRRMRRQRISTPVVVFTQFKKFDDDKNSMSLDELNDDLRSRFSNYLGTIEYQVNVEGWKDRVSEFLAAVEAGKNI